MQIINIKRFTCYNDMTAEVGSGINQEKLAGGMVEMGRTWSNIWFGKLVYSPERGQEVHRVPPVAMPQL
jgi:hypothetical protein